MTDTPRENLVEELSKDGWQRLSVVSVVYFVLRFIIGFARHGIQNIAIFGGIFFATGDRRLTTVFLLLGAGLVLLLAASVLSYINFRFRLNSNAFLIHSGVLSKKRLTLSFDRIQNIAIKQPFYFRPFGLVTVALESAGSASEEVNLAGIDRTLAEELRKTVLAQPQTTQPTAPGDSAKVQEASLPDDGETLLHHPVSELARYGLSNNNIWVFAGLLAGAISQVDEKIGNAINDWIKGPEDYFAALDTVTATVIGAGLVVLLFGLLLLGSVIGAIIIYHDYRLSFTGGRFLRTNGLFERSETSLPVNKVQALEINQPWPARLMGRSHATLLQVGFKNQWEDGNINPKQAKFIVPSLTDDRCRKLVAALYPSLDWDAVSFQGVHPMYLRRLFFIDFVLPVLVPSGILAAFASPWFLLANLIPVLLLPLMRLNYQKRGYWCDGAHIIVRTGIIGHKLVVFPVQKAQSVKITRTPGQRRRGLASLTIKLAGHKVKIPYMPAAIAEGLRDHILRLTSMKNISWM